MLKPASAGKARSNALAGLPGVAGDSARGKNRQELGRPDSVFDGNNRWREAITVGEAGSRRRRGS